MTQRGRATRSPAVRQHGGVRFLSLLPALALLVVAPGQPAAAASCRVMTVGYAFASGSVVALDPDHVDIAYGGCVQFTNNTATTVTVTVAGGYEQDVAPGGTTPQDAAYVGTDPGRHAVTARSGPTSATGSVRVAAAPEPSRSATGSRSPRATSGAARTSSPRPRPSSAPAPAPAPARPSAPGPAVAPTPTPAPSAVVAPAPTPTPAPTSTSPSPQAAVAGPIEPASGRGGGLPAALAALALVGTAGAYLRVLVAEPVAATGPVDTGRTVGSRA